MPLADSIASVLAVLALAAGASAQTVQCAGAGTPIPDGSSVSVVLTVPSDPGATVEEVMVSIDLAHEWLGDLTITLTHDGVSAVLIDRIASDTWSFGCGGKDIDAHFTGSAVTSADELCSPGGPTPMLAGDILPAESLAVFNGSPVEGDWTVTITDHNPIDTGVIHSVCISIVPVPGADCDGDVDGNLMVDLDDLNLVLTNFGQATSEGDADGNGEVNLDDLNLVLTNFGTSC
jgi:subtilisin-like proprotein convertase family protein